jgi:Regulator of ribonuclease activity B
VFFLTADNRRWTQIEGTNRRSIITFPNDENGDVLRRMQASGDNLEKPRDIDFNFIFEKEDDATGFCIAVRKLGFERVRLKFWEEEEMRDVQVTIFLMPTYAEITQTELKLDTLSREFCGRADGWGGFAQK